MKPWHARSIARGGGHLLEVRYRVGRDLYAEGDDPFSCSKFSNNCWRSRHGA